MTTLNIPGSPSTGDTYEANGVVYTWDGSKWKADSSYVSNLNGGQLAGFRNLFINADFRISQRGGPFVGVSADTYTFDRWKYQGPGTATVEAWPSNQTLDEFQGVGLRATSASSVLQGFSQTIETQNCKHFYGKTVTVSCYASAAPVIQVVRQNGDSTFTTVTNNVAMTLLGSVGTGSLNYYALSIDIPAVQIGETSGSFFVNNAFGLRFSILATSTVFDIYNCQVELGPVATPFEHRPIQTELALCQRYYRTGSVRYWGNVTSGQLYVGQDTFLKMRVAPTAALVSDAGSDPADIAGFNSYTSASIRDTTPDSVSSISQATYAGTGRYWYAYTADAEL